MISLGRTRLFVLREIAHALRARWFLVYSGIFLVGGLVLSAVGATDTLLAGYRSYARSLAGLVHFSILFVPLMALFPAAAALAEERESGTLEYLLAQPVTRGEVILGKWTGVALAVCLSLTLGYLLSGGVAVARGVPIRFVLLSYALLLLLALAFVSIGIVASAFSGTRSRAVTVGLVVWVSLVSLGSLGVIAAFVRWGFPSGLLTVWSFVNPVEAFRIGMVTIIDPDLGMLGPVGASFAEAHGTGAILFLSAASLAGWTTVSTLVSVRGRPPGSDGP